MKTIIMMQEKKTISLDILLQILLAPDFNTLLVPLNPQAVRTIIIILMLILPIRSMQMKKYLMM